MTPERRFWLVCFIGFAASMTEPDIELRRWWMRFALAAFFAAVFVFKGDADA